MVLKIYKTLGKPYSQQVGRKTGKGPGHIVNKLVDSIKEMESVGMDAEEIVDKLLDEGNTQMQIDEAFSNRAEEDTKIYGNKRKKKIRTLVNGRVFRLYEDPGYDEPFVIERSDGSRIYNTYKNREDAMKEYSMLVRLNRK